MTVSVLSVVGPVGPFGPPMFTLVMPALVFVVRQAKVQRVAEGCGCWGGTRRKPYRYRSLWPPLFTLLICKELEELVLVTTKFESVPLPREIVSVVPVIAMSRVFAAGSVTVMVSCNAAGREGQRCAEPS